jgi:glutaredoxin
MYIVMGHAACSFCKQAILLLASKGKSFEYIDVRDPENVGVLEDLKEAGLTTVPQVWANEEHLGGMAELQGYLSGPH